MAFSSGDPIEYGKELADRTKSPWDFAGTNLMDQFKKKKEIDYELQKIYGLADYKERLDRSSPEAIARTENYKANAAYTNRALGNLPANSASLDPDSADANSQQEPGMIFTGMSGKSAQFSSPAGMRQKGQIENELGAEGKQIEAGGKLSSGIKRLNIINQQYLSALPAKNTNPFTQRIKGPLAVIGAKTGLVPNAKLLAIKKNSRPIAVQLMRAFGEVSGLSEIEQSSALETVSSESLNDDERIEKVKQFAEFALAGAPPKALEYMMKDPVVADIVKTLGIKIPGYTDNEQGMVQNGAKNPIQQEAANQSSKFQEGYESKAGYVKLNGKWYKKNG